MIEVRNLVKRFGSRDALKGINLHIEKGMIFALVGADGAGKTTLLRTLAGILTPDDGEISILGRDIIKDPECAKEHIGYLSQRFSLNPSLTVAENIDFFGALFQVPYGEREKRTKRLMEFSRLGPFRDRQAGKLSGGMKQKLALCCALIHTPDILLLDEPTTGVDPISRRELWEILYDLLGEGVTIVVSTPYMDEAERAGEIMLIHNGRAVISGTLDQLKASYRYFLFEAVCDQNRQALRLVSDHLGKNRVMFFGDRLHIALNDGSESAGIKSLLENSGIQILSLLKIDPGLEDIFIQETSGDN